MQYILEKEGVFWDEKCYDPEKHQSCTVLPGEITFIIFFMKYIIDIINSQAVGRHLWTIWIFFLKDSSALNR